MRRIALLIASLLLTLALAASASAAGFDQVYADYKSDGKIDACRFSAADLKSARGSIPPDIEQYAPDFPAALDAAIEARARTGCKAATGTTATTAAAAAAATPPAAGAAAAAPSGTGATPGAAGATATPGTATTAAGSAGTTPAPASAAGPAGAPDDAAVVLAAQRTRASDGASSVPAPLVALLVFAGLLALVAIAAALVRWLAWEPRWLVGARHAGAEAGHRASARWAEFADWVRLGH